MHRVAITGMGVLSALGNDVPTFTEALFAGRCGLVPMEAGDIGGADPASLSQRLFGPVRGFDLEALFDRDRLALMDRFSALAVVAARQALAQSGLELRGTSLATRTATIVGTGVGGMVATEESYRRTLVEGKARAHPFTVPRLMINACASQVSMDLGLQGPGFTVSSACSSANHAIGLAFQMIRSGMVDAALTGGTDANGVWGVIKAWEALRVMSNTGCRPFSADRNGMVLAEGAGMVVLERLDHAQARGATVLAELVGFGQSSDAGDIVTPSLEGTCAAVQAALQDAGLAPEDVDYINAHGTATTVNDRTETATVRSVFGAAADRLAISSTKSMHGHALGAAGALELVATVAALQRQTAPPTVGYTQADPDCDLDVVPNTARAMPIRAALSNSFAFGGLNAVLAVRAV